MTHAWISLAVFAACYALFVILPERRPWTACAGAAALVLAGVVGWREALFQKINWNVMGLFFGTLILAEAFLLSRVPAVMAEWLVDKAPTARAAMLSLCALSGFISIFVENVAVVLLVAPVALSLADKLRANPVPLLIGIAVSSNLQGTATMIGDPPSMILAGYMKIGFWDFFIHKGRLSIFFAVELGAVASLLVLAWVFRRHKEKTAFIAQEAARSWVPAALLVLLVLGLSVATLVDPDFEWFAGVFTLALGAVCVVWFRWVAKWGGLRDMGKALDWGTTFFLIGVFVLVGGLSESGWLEKLADAMAGLVGASRFVAFAAITLFAVGVSGFVDNVPFLLAMIPVAQTVAEKMQAPEPLLLFGLLVGACLGGNLTPIGASANVVTLGILKKRGHATGFWPFMRIGIPFTAAAVLAACALVWVVWNK
ncbi:MAG TPA: SLC13 family permease [Candidatus Brocadiia bacterium]|nr:SLC13 family permease [Candidatus Brocadiia bacterium]